MNNEPLVSVIIPMYNAEKYIAETLESLFSQTYANFEVVIVDNASTDKSVEIVNLYRDKLRLNVIICVENSGGPAKPRNIGIEHSKGEYVAFLDSDDIWDESKLSKQLGKMLESGYNFTCTSRSYINEISTEFIRKIDMLLPIKTGRYSIEDLIRRNNITTSSVVIKKVLLDTLKFDDSAVMACVEDYLLWLNLFNLKECNFYHLKEPLVKYRIFEQSLSQKDGRLLILAKSILASSYFMVTNKRKDLLLASLTSHFFRVLCISVFNFFKK